jgi:hypothetical protein
VIDPNMCTPSTGSTRYVAADDLMLGDVVRRVGRPLQVGIVLGMDGDVALVRWYANGPVDRRHRSLLQRRTDR